MDEMLANIRIHTINQLEKVNKNQLSVVKLMKRDRKYTIKN